jgi:hypothetical protein
VVGTVRWAVSFAVSQAAHCRHESPSRIVRKREEPPYSTRRP